MSEPTVSVIICCYTEKRLKDIREAAEAVLAQTLKPHEVIISVDHNKQLYEILKSYYLTAQQTQQTQGTLSTSQTKIVLNEGAPGLSETRNVGIRACRGDIVAFIDDDALAEPDWLENLIRPFQSPQQTEETQTTQGTVMAVGGRAIPLWLNGSRPFWFPEELDWIVGCTYKGLPTRTLNFEPRTLHSEDRTSNLEPRTLNFELRAIRNVHGCNMALRKEVFERVGGFRSDIGGLKETPRGGEEADLCLRISHAMPEALIAYQEHAIIHHKVTPRRTTWRYLWQRSYNEGFYKAKVQKLHQPTQQTPSTQQTQKTLSTEDSYLRYLLFRSIPDRLARFYRKGSLPQIAAIIVCIGATGVGYLVGRMRG